MAAGTLPFSYQTLQLALAVVFGLGIVFVDGIAIGMTINGIRIYHKISKDTRRKFHKLKVWVRHILTKSSLCIF